MLFCQVLHITVTIFAVFTANLHHHCYKYLYIFLSIKLYFHSSNLLQFFQQTLRIFTVTFNFQFLLVLRFKCLLVKF